MHLGIWRWLAKFKLWLGMIKKGDVDFEREWPALSSQVCSKKSGNMQQVASERDDVRIQKRWCLKKASVSQMFTLLDVEP